MPLSVPCASLRPGANLDGCNRNAYGVGLGQKPTPIYLRARQTMHLGIAGLGE